MFSEKKKFFKKEASQQDQNALIKPSKYSHTTSLKYNVFRYVKSLEKK